MVHPKKHIKTVFHDTRLTMGGACTYDIIGDVTDLFRGYNMAGINILRDREDDNVFHVKINQFEIVAESPLEAYKKALTISPGNMYFDTYTMEQGTVRFSVNDVLHVVLNKEI